jgi:hypothetical protein
MLSQARSFAVTYDREAGLSPTRITPNPGVVPFADNAATLSFNSLRTASAMAFPSMIFAATIVSSFLT